MMNTGQHQEPRQHYDVELADACIACGGPLAARFTAGSAAAVCVACRRISVLGVERGTDGMRVMQLPAGDA